MITGWTTTHALRRATRAGARPGGSDAAAPAALREAPDSLPHYCRPAPQGGSVAEGQAPRHGARHCAALAQATGATGSFALPARLIQGGEEVVLAIKPGGLFVLLVGAPFISALMIIFMAAVALDYSKIFDLPLTRLGMIWMLGALVRVIIGCFQWLGRTYVLTNKRIITIRGLVGISVFECPLNRIQNTMLSLGALERVFGLGTVLFATAGTGAVESTWEMVSTPVEVHEIVIRYINRSQSGSM